MQYLRWSEAFSDPAQAKERFAPFIHNIDGLALNLVVNLVTNLVTNLIANQLWMVINELLNVFLRR